MIDPTGAQPSRAAAAGLALTIPRPSAVLSRSTKPGRLVLRPAADAISELAAVHDPVHDRAQPLRAGSSRRGQQGWRLRLFDPPSRRAGRTELQAVLHLDGHGGADGYALDRTKEASAGAPGGNFRVGWIRQPFCPQLFDRLRQRTPPEPGHGGCSTGHQYRLRPASTSVATGAPQQRQASPARR